MIDLLASFGCRASFSDDDVLHVEVPERLQPHASYDLVSRMRASIAVLGPLLARCGEAMVALPEATISVPALSTCTSRPWNVSASTSR